MVGFEKALGAVKVIKDQIQYKSQSLLNLARGYFIEINRLLRECLDLLRECSDLSIFILTLTQSGNSIITTMCPFEINFYGKTIKLTNFGMARASKIAPYKLQLSSSLMSKLISFIIKSSLLNPQISPH